MYMESLELFLIESIPGCQTPEMKIKASEIKDNFNQKGLIDAYEQA